LRKKAVNLKIKNEIICVVHKNYFVADFMLPIKAIEECVTIRSIVINRATITIQKVGKGATTRLPTHNYPIIIFEQ